MKVDMSTSRKDLGLILRLGMTSGEPNPYQSGDRFHLTD